MRYLLFLLVLLLLPANSWAAVQVSFYSREPGSQYPHAFIVVKGKVDATGEAVDANFGWTNPHPSPLLLVKPLRGIVTSSTPAYIAKSINHFTLTLSDDEYRTLMARIQYWRDKPQPSYDLNKANCVYFAADMAMTLGLKVSVNSDLMMRPTLFMEQIKTDNQAFLASRLAEPAAIAGHDAGTSSAGLSLQARAPTGGEPAVAAN